MTLFFKPLAPDAHHSSQYGEKGNALWFILLAIALLTALTIAITKSGDNVQQSGEAERSTIEASRIMRDAKAMEVTIQSMIARGASQSDICFDADFWGHDDYDFPACTNTSNRVFDDGGAGLPQPRTTPSQTIAYTGSLAIDGVGTAAPELVFVMSGLGEKDCLRINRILNIADDGGQPPTITNAVTYAEFIGTYATGNTVTAPEILRKSAGCVTGNGAAGKTLYNGAYHYFHVLIPR